MPSHPADERDEGLASWLAGFGEVALESLYGLVEPLRFLDISREALGDVVIRIVMAARIGRHQFTERILKKGVELADRDAQRLAEFEQLILHDVFRKAIYIVQHAAGEKIECDHGASTSALEFGHLGSAL